jgi:outer membrane protein assembly factor BamA
VPEGEYLLRQSKVKVERTEKNQLSRRERNVLKNELSILQRQEPNKRFALMPIGLWIYNSVDENKNNWWARTVRKAGQPPVIFDSMLAEQSVRQMQLFLVNKGRFSSKVSYDVGTLRRSQKVNLTFDVNPSPGYHYRNVSIDVRDDSLKHLFNNWLDRTLIKSGDPYDVDILEAERLRTARRLQNLGYFLFTRDNIEFSIDSSLNSFQMNITMIVSSPRNGGHHEKYTFDDVYIFPDESPERSEKTFDTTTYQLSRSRRDTTLLNYHFVHSKPLQINPRSIVSKLAIHPGDPFSLTAIDRTYENLLDLRVFRVINIPVQPQPIDSNNPQHLLNTSIEVRQADAIVWTNELEATNASSLQGIVVNTSLQNRNLFRGAEILSLRLRALLDMQYLLNPSLRQELGLPFVDNFDIGISAGLDIPRFITPFNVLQTTSVHRPRTTINIGYNYRDRFRFYNRQLTNLSFGYSWRTPQVSHFLFPLDINLINIALTDSFQRTIDDLSQNNRRLENQYKNTFIFASRYGFSYSGQQGNRPINFNAFRFSVETAGNLLYLFSNLTNAPKHGVDQQHQFFNLVYAQYVRTDADFRRYWFLNDNHVLVTRLMGGIGLAYGNKKDLPYDKGFFAGGNNNIRAWPMNMLGPGSFSNPENVRIERIGDIVLVGNVEYRFPISGAFKGAWFVDAGNIWLRDDADAFPGGQFEWNNVPNDLAVGGGFGLRLDLIFLVIRLDAALPLRNPAKPDGKKWVVDNTKFRDLVFNFGIGYPF